ncbi:MAG: penicillin-binding protein 2 [Bacteroidales bacterium]|nr:penicillin-binding protein 2 [Bacteroidales bacterium]
MEKLYLNRKFIILGLFLFTGIIFIIRLFYIQVMAENYILSANNNVLRYITQYPARGLIYDRNGKLLVYNEAAYDMMVIPREVKAMDTSEFCRLLGITVNHFRERLTQARRYSSYKPSVFESQINRENFGALQEKMFMFHGFFVQPRTLRSYSYPAAAHMLGYIGEASPSIIAQSPYYKASDYIGISGIEKSYETELRGRKGMKIRVVDVHNRDMGSFQEGHYDTISLPGRDLWSSIDVDLQILGEELMRNKKGSIVAIEPSSGEVLCLVSSPSYDPNLLVGRIRNHNFSLLSADSINIPLFNRALMATYPPGSTFKTVNALVGLQEGVITASTRFGCPGGFALGNGHVVGCHDHAGPLDLEESIQHSCNTYYCRVFKSILEKDGFYATDKDFNIWRNHILSFGLGKRIGLDLPSELSGNIPSSAYYDKYYGKNRWRSLTVISLAIGQGEVLVTPVQLANMTTVIANRGYYIIPHVIKGVGQPDSVNRTLMEKHFCTVDPGYFDVVVDGMEKVVLAGTATNARLDSISICAKTGTAQNPHGDNHSIFIAFAPKDNPKIAISVIVENAGWGASWAAPIASLMIEQYLKGEVKRSELKERMMNGNLIKP